MYYMYTSGIGFYFLHDLISNLKVTVAFCVKKSNLFGRGENRCIS
jgi:hypothetical protein